MANKWVYMFEEGDMTMRNLLGGKGANLAEMTKIGLPVPQGFTVTTEACTQYYEDGRKINDEIMAQVMEGVKKMEEINGKKFGDLKNPLLVSVRSGARASMPGMMDTILNLGLNDEVVATMIAGNDDPAFERFVYDSYRRFIQMFSDVVMEVGKKYFEELIDKMKEEKGVTFDVELTADDLKELASQFKAEYKEKIGEDFPSCEFCGSKVSSADEKCPTCGGNFGKNKEYQLKKRAMHQRYLEYMKSQEEAITQETEYISTTMQAIQKYKLIRHKYYNFEIGEPPVYKPASDYEFTCEYCDNKIRGKSTDEKGCSNCGASYKENLELLVREEEDRLEKRHYDEYMKLKDLEWEQNIRNERRDANIDEKYGTPIRFMEKNAKVIALVILLGLMMISVGITVLILKFR